MECNNTIQDKHGLKVFKDNSGKSFVHVNDLKSALSQKYRQAILLSKPSRNLDIMTDPYNQRNTVSTLKLGGGDILLSRNPSVFDWPYLPD